MRSAWSSHSAVDRHAVPIEMRFIDLFMAALGALIFMAMLLAFLLRFTPLTTKPVEVTPPAGPEVPPTLPLKIATSSLPPAVLGEPYEVTFAYRGGSGTVAWELPVGTREIPAGLHFDAQLGVLSGKPRERADARFILQVSDTQGHGDQRPFELLVEAPRNGSKRAEILLAIAVEVLLSWFWKNCLLSNRYTQRMLTVLKEARRQGRSSVEMEDPKRIQKLLIKLPEGIGIHEANLLVGRRKSRAFLFALLFSTAWFAWRIWGS